MLSDLAREDAWWRAQWKRVRRVRLLAGLLGLPAEDVVLRLRRAGVEIRGRPPQGVVEVTVQEAEIAPGPTRTAACQIRLPL